MKFKVGDNILVTGGKDKGKTAKIVRVLPKENKVVVDGINMYVKHRKPMNDQPGEKLTLPRPLPTGKIAILNDKGVRDRIGYVMKNDKKVRIFKKTGAEVPETKIEVKKTAKK